LLSLPILILALSLSLAGCAEFQDHPLDPAASAARIEARSLADAGLRRFMESLLGPLAEWPPKAWDLDRLTLVAIHHHPDLAVARAQADMADAAAITAAQRPNPFITLTPTWISNLATAAAAPWIATTAISIPIETAGKRGYRMDRAAQLTDTARLRVVDMAWQARARLRLALLEVYAAQEAERLSQNQLGIQEAMSQRLEQQLAAGEIARPEVIRSHIALNQLRLNISAARKRSAESRVMLAAAIGVPVDALAGVELDFANLSAPPALEALPLHRLREAALRKRPDLLAALADYAAAQSALQLEIANQYPNLQANPGYAWEVGEHRWTLGAMMQLPILHQNQGAIAEAEAKRSESAARFDVLQTRILEDIDRARASLETVLAKWDDAERQRGIQRDGLRSAQALFRAGETDRLALLGAELELAAAERARLDVLVETQQAVNALEDSLRYPVASALTPALISASSAKEIPR
jgi:outer membrane protein TolC